MATFKIILYTQRLNSLGEGTVYLRIIKDRKVSMRSLDIKVHPNYWDEATGTIVKKHPKAKEWNAIIKEKLAEAERAGSLAEVEPETTAKQIVEAVVGKPKVSFIKGVEQYIQQCQKKGQEGTADKAKATLYKFKRFLVEKDLTYCELTYAVVKQFEGYLEAQGNNTNTISSNMSVLRRVYNRGVEADIIDDSKSPWRRYKLKRTTSKKRYLTSEELDMIQALPLVEGSVKWHSRNLFLFSACGTALRISDLLQLTWSQVKGGRLRLTTQKTNDQLDIPLIKGAREILALYKEGRDNELIFPILKYRGQSARQKFLALSSATALVNKMLKAIAEEAGVKKFSAHAARHTLITSALKKGMAIHLVQRVASHKSIKTTTIYSHIVNADVDKALLEAFD